MPIRVTTPAGAGLDYASPFIGPVDHTVQLAVTLTNLTNKEIDKYGYLKPGVPFDKAGVPIATGKAVFGVTVEAVKVAADNAAATIAALTTAQVALAMIAVLNRDVVEDILGRALTADEIAGFDLAGSHIRLTNT
jgi:hypothetical protein